MPFLQYSVEFVCESTNRNAQLHNKKDSSMVTISIINFDIHYSP